MSWVEKIKGKVLGCAGINTKVASATIRQSAELFPGNPFLMAIHTSTANLEQEFDLIKIATIVAMQERNLQRGMSTKEKDELDKFLCASFPDAKPTLLITYFEAVPYRKALQNLGISTGKEPRSI